MAKERITPPKRKKRMDLEFVFMSVFGVVALSAHIYLLLKTGGVI